jgi:hypothetical protein
VFQNDSFGGTQANNKNVHMTTGLKKANDPEIYSELKKMKQNKQRQIFLDDEESLEEIEFPPNITTNIHDTN